MLWYQSPYFWGNVAFVGMLVAMGVVIWLQRRSEKRNLDGVTRDFSSKPRNRAFDNLGVKDLPQG